MLETVTVNKALNRGRLTILYPITLFMLGSIGLAIYLVIHLSFPPWVLTIGFAVAFIFRWLYWSFMITKWRLWAFENVLDIHELKQRAIRIRLIYPDGSILERMEIRTSEDKERLRLIQKKFEQPDINN